MTLRTVSVAIDTDNDADFAKAFEVLGRTAAGLIIDGLDARLYSYPTDEETG